MLCLDRVVFLLDLRQKPHLHRLLHLLHLHQYMKHHRHHHPVVLKFQLCLKKHLDHQHRQEQL